MRVKVYYESWIAKLLIGCSSIMLFGTVHTVFNERLFSETSRTHESIHALQWIEVSILSAIILIGLIVFGTLPIWSICAAPLVWYLLYLLEWLYQCVVWLFDRSVKAYYFICYEQEAYDNDNNPNYIDERKPFAWVHYLGKWEKY